MMDRILVPLVTVAVTAALAFVCSSGAAAHPPWQAVIFVPYVLLAGVAVWRMNRDGTLLDLFRWRSGDVSLGFLTAGLLGLGVWAGRWMLAPPGSAGEFWLIRLYLQLGEVPAGRALYLRMAGGLVALAMLEEIVWRGLVQQILEEKWGARRGWLGTTILYGATHLPTFWLLAMPPAGKNPLFFLTASVGGCLWGFLVGRLQRLPPAMISHGFFTYAMAMQFRLWR